MIVVRSPYAHAKVTSVDVAAAREAPRASSRSSRRPTSRRTGRRRMPCAWPVTEDMKNPPHYPLTDVARYQGDGVAVVIAESRAQAKDAAELVEVDYEPLDAVVERRRRRSRTARRSRIPTSDERVLRLAADTDATGEAIDDAEVVVTRRYLQPRLIPNAIEPRAVARRARGRAGDVTLYAATQIPHILRLARRGDPRDAARRSSASSRPTSAAASARSSTSTPRTSSRSRSRDGSAARSSGRRSAPRTTSRRSTAATSSPSTRSPRRRTARSRTAARA